ncbi:hypothetical protein [Paenibacillus sp. GYB003]|uniref:hypothetical protein n=1 Tax=Paenibacillus sp. GYB003 TaxID=2994392 RepID=UPI002F96B315
MTVFWKAINDQFCLKIEQDFDALHPRRENDNLGTMICWHRRYHLGDEHRFAEPREFMESLADGFEIKRIEERSDKDLFEQVARHAIILPIYAYEHGAITIRTAPFSCPWDSGQVGWIYISKKKAREEFGKLTQSRVSYIENLLKAEVQEYDDYLQGNVFGFTLYSVEAELREYLSEAGTDVYDLSFDEWSPFLKKMDSCWGFIGNNHHTNGISECLPEEARSLLSDLREGCIIEDRKLQYA